MTSGNNAATVFGGSVTLSSGKYSLAASGGGVSDAGEVAGAVVAAVVGAAAVAAAAAFGASAAAASLATGAAAVRGAGVLLAARPGILQARPAGPKPAIQLISNRNARIAAMVQYTR